MNNLPDRRKLPDRSKKKGFMPLSGMLSTRMDRHSIGRQLEARQILEVAQRILVALWGEDRAGHCEMASFSEGILSIRILSAPALQTFKNDQMRYINAVNRELGERRILQIQFRKVGF
ncbi:MAG: DUF721 domain-containing protein [bacterium]|nr:DUF721 domain-containing protein [bacterium]